MIKIFKFSLIGLIFTLHFFAMADDLTVRQFAVTVGDNNFIDVIADFEKNGGTGEWEILENPFNAKSNRRGLYYIIHKLPIAPTATAQVWCLRLSSCITRLNALQKEGFPLILLNTLDDAGVQAIEIKSIESSPQFQGLQETHKVPSNVSTLFLNPQLPEETLVHEAQHLHDDSSGWYENTWKELVPLANEAGFSYEGLQTIMLYIMEMRGYSAQEIFLTHLPLDGGVLLDMAGQPVTGQEMSRTMDFKIMLTRQCFGENYFTLLASVLTDLKSENPDLERRWAEALQKYNLPGALSISFAALL